MHEKIKKALDWRYAIKIFDKKKRVSDEDIELILESGRMSPSSNGLEPWHFFVVTDEETRKRLREASFDQPKVTDASHLIVIAYETNPEKIVTKRLERTARAQNQEITELGKYKEYLEQGIKSHEQEGDLAGWLRAQAYIPLGMMVLTAALLEIDVGPMEGFQTDKVDEILGLKELGLKSTTMLAVGYRGEDPYTAKPKVRKLAQEVETRI